MCMCNTFNAVDIKMQWDRVEELWKRDCLELAGLIVGHASDGDSRRRSVQLSDYCRRAATSQMPAADFRIDWPGFSLGCLIDGEGNVSGLHDQDWVHNTKKLISPLDSACRTLWLGPFIVRLEHIVKVYNTLPFEDHGLGQMDVDRNDRQNFKDKYPCLAVPLSRTWSDVCEIFFSKVRGMAGVERAYDFGDLLRSAGSLNRLAEIESMKDGVVVPRAHDKMKCVWEELHPVPCDDKGLRVGRLPNLGDYSEVSTDSDIILALEEGFKEAQTLLRVLDMAPSVHCRADKAAWFKRPWDFEDDLSAKLKDLTYSSPEEGDDGNVGSDVDEEPVGHLTSVEVDVDTKTDGELSSALAANAANVQAVTIVECAHVIGEMKDAMHERCCGRDVNQILGKTINPQVPLPGKSGEVIWKARLVSQLNGNPFLSKDRLQRVKGVGNQYYSREELQRLKDDPSIISLTTGHDVAVLFESEEIGDQSVAHTVKSKRNGKAAEVTKKTSSKAYFELGRVQILRKKKGGKWVSQKDIIDLENVGNVQVQVYLYWYSEVTGRSAANKFNKWKYDSDDKCWVDLATVIQLVNLEYKPGDKTYVLDPTDKHNLIKYVNAHNNSD
ncbi:hypothetical protein R1sor_020660 [Riccia sorocarpa]|uniref:Uncharacterized protein n=1 Tax=Riccia sorocarpa TaxID=122646 RepID=A0ABD3GKI6_9MARC